MAVTGIFGASSPTVIIQEGSSINGFLVFKTTLGFGEVVQVYAGCLNYAAGDNVFFDNSEARPFKLSSTQYYAVKESDIYFKETPPLP